MAQHKRAGAKHYAAVGHRAPSHGLPSQLKTCLDTSHGYTVAWPLEPGCHLILEVKVHRVNIFALIKYMGKPGIPSRLLKSVQERIAVGNR